MELFVEDFHQIFFERNPAPPPQIEDIRLEILWYCRMAEGELWPDDIALRLKLDFNETADAMGLLADAGQIAHLSYGKRWLPPRAF